MSFNSVRTFVKTVFFSRYDEKYPHICKTGKSTKNNFLVNLKKTERGDLHMIMQPQTHE